MRRGWRGGGVADSGEAKSKRDSERGDPRRVGGRERTVAAGGAGLNINPRGRPGRAPVLVRLGLNPRNHAVDRRAAYLARVKPGKVVRARDTLPLPFVHVIGRSKSCWRSKLKNTLEKKCTTTRSGSSTMTLS